MKTTTRQRETYLHSARPFRNCWHLVGSSSDSGGRRQSCGECRCTIMQSDSWRHSASAFPVVHRLFSQRAARFILNRRRLQDSAGKRANSACSLDSIARHHRTKEQYSRISLHELGILTNAIGSYLSIAIDNEWLAGQLRLDCPTIPVSQAELPNPRTA